MNAKSISETVALSSRGRFSAVKNLRPENLARALEAFENGRLGEAARIFDSIVKRDDVISGLYLKRCKCISRLDYEIVEKNDSPRAKEHAEALRKFYDSIEVSDIADTNRKGGIRTLIMQMMGAVGMKYSAHKIEYFRNEESVSAKFTHYPLWLFENTEGRLRLLEREGQLTKGDELKEDEWLITVSDGIMSASSIAYMFKQLALRDWIIYCERNGMPGVKAKTDAYPGTEQWEAACQAASEFGAEFHAVFSQGTDMEAIDLSSRGALPYPELIDRMDRMLCALWRGGDLATLSGAGNLGSTSQWYESSLIEEDDSENIAEALHKQVDKNVLKLVFGDEAPLAKFSFKLADYEMHMAELEVVERLVKLGLQADVLKIAKRFGFPLASENNVNETPQAKETSDENK